ncbi:DUF1904 family protein [Mesoplasma lactucae]|uniref:Uncharacterized protein n=1 Tax=Mesoplasma lactucae ATCC 49193 TaxID=81460 RepID=A0A291ISF3_9MOLU|nr:DUF1904 family protein [Mesoplasma lactucae]ATG97683.1 hypothetical protein CP520_03005 [Mesoplasma lactucae ATCC 49193]ATZ19852.1 hypothetical protein MLACT_v1c00270 [Mesoplasma lactucae ATCC 49193]MCL8216715.1 hypothetical protein [Mesoplasma lactucae ATCC 49193]
MPNIKFSGVDKSVVEKYALKIDEIATLINANKEAIIFIATNDEIFPKRGKQTPIFITVEWKQRLDKEEIFSKHLTEFFKEYSDSVRVFFTDINDKWYVNGNKA